MRACLRANWRQPTYCKPRAARRGAARLLSANSIRPLVDCLTSRHKKYFDYMRIFLLRTNFAYFRLFQSVEIQFIGIFSAYTPNKCHRAPSPSLRCSSSFGGRHFSSTVAASFRRFSAFALYTSICARLWQVAVDFWRLCAAASNLMIAILFFVQSNVIVDALLSIGARLVIRILQQIGVVRTRDSSPICSILSLLCVCFFISGSFTLLFLCLERFLATRWHKSYEQTGSRLSVASICTKVSIFFLFWLHERVND